MNEAYEFLKACGVYYLATVEDGHPRVRPFGTVDLFEDRVYIQTGAVKSVARQLKAEPRVEICAMKGDTWIRVEAEAVLDERLAAQEHMLSAYPSLRNMYAPGDGNTEVYWLKNARATFCTFGKEPRVVTF